MMDRRNFLAAMLAGCAAPAVVRVGSLMRIKPIVWLEELDLTEKSILGLLVEMNETQGPIMRAGSVEALWPGLKAYYNEYYRDLSIAMQGRFPLK